MLSHCASSSSFLSACRVSPPSSAAFLPSPAISSPTSPSPLFTSLKSLNPGRRSRILHRGLRSPTTGSADTQEEEEDRDEYIDVDVSDDDDADESTVDLEALEEEAKSVAREYSLSLSRELSTGDETDFGKGTGKSKRHKSAFKNVPDHLLPRVAIVGRPNVGKSALFNRLVGGGKAIVVDEPGVTRDRLYGRSFWGDYEFMVVDTGGVFTISGSQANVMEELAIKTTIGMEGIPLASREAAVARMPSMIEKQATVAVEESRVIIFLVDGKAGLSAADVEIAGWLRKNYSNKRIILAVNKCESPRKGAMQASEFWSLGFSPIPISAITGTGTGELLDLVCSGIEKTEVLDNLHEKGNYVPALAIVGRPNVGKSSILNALVGEDRTIVSPISGTTRDAIDTEFTGLDGQKYRLIDTAGIRKRTAVYSAGSTTEALSVNRAFRAIRRSDIVALVIEAMACITEQVINNNRGQSMGLSQADACVSLDKKIFSQGHGVLFRPGRSSDCVSLDSQRAL